MVKKFSPRSDFSDRGGNFGGSGHFLTPFWGSILTPKMGPFLGPFLNRFLKNAYAFFKNGSKKRKQKNLAVRTLGGGVVT